MRVCVRDLLVNGCSGIIWSRPTNLFNEVCLGRNHGGKLQVPVSHAASAIDVVPAQRIHFRNAGGLDTIKDEGCQASGSNALLVSRNGEAANRLLLPNVDIPKGKDGNPALIERSGNEFVRCDLGALCIPDGVVGANDDCIVQFVSPNNRLQPGVLVVGKDDVQFGAIYFGTSLVAEVFIDCVSHGG